MVYILGDNKYFDVSFLLYELTFITLIKRFTMHTSSWDRQFLDKF